MVGWVGGTRRRRPQPVRYTFLDHSFKNSRFRPRGRPAPPGEVLQVRVHGIAEGGARPDSPPDGAESGDDQDDGELVIEAR